MNITQKAVFVANNGSEFATKEEAISADVFAFLIGMLDKTDVKLTYANRGAVAALAGQLHDLVHLGDVIRAELRKGEE